MKKIAFIIPWAGKLPNYFPLWLETCRWNPTIDFLLFTNDKTNFDYPQNVIVHYMSFQEMRSFFQQTYNFPLALDAPYKFCDFKPAYGEIFSQYIEGYDYWGHCDIDLFWGDIRHFLTDEVLMSAERIFSRGHCSLYKNTPEVNIWYRTLPCNGCQNWKDVFQSSKSYCFDEWAGHCGGGISQIIKSNGIKIFDEIYMADLNVMTGYFKINGKDEIQDKDVYFEFDKGKLFCISSTRKEEIIYTHFQKRKINIDEYLNYQKFYFVSPNSVTSDEKNIKRHRYSEKQYEINKILEKVKRKIKER